MPEREKKRKKERESKKEEAELKSFPVHLIVRRETFLGAALRRRPPESCVRVSLAVFKSRAFFSGMERG